MPKSKKENIEEMTLDPIEEKVKDPAPVEEPVEPETVEEGEDITEPDAPIEPEFEEPDEEGGQGEDVEFDEEAGEETDEDAPEEDAPPFLGLMLGAKNAPVSEDPDPQSRIEALLWHIINGTTTDAEPQSRNEAILTAIANSGTYTEEAQSRIEALLIAILNHEESDIAPISRNEAILKAIANTGEYNEEPQSRNEELLIKWLEAISIVIGTASGAVASFNTSLTEPLVKCECEFSASQASGTPTPSAPIPIVGVDKVNVSRTGKNLLGGSALLSNAQNHLPNGTTDTTNKTFTYSATTAARSGTTFTDGIKFKENTQYTFIMTASKSSVDDFNMRVNYTDGTNAQITGSGTAKNTAVYVSASGKTVASLIKTNRGGNTTLYYDECGIFEGDLSETDFEPYNGTTALINLGGTYYGGSVDAVTGKITKQIDTYTITGEETSVQILQGSNNNGYRIGILLANSTNKYSGLLSSVSENASILNSATWEIGKFCTYSGRLYITVPNEYDTVAKALEYLTGGVFEYELATPETVYASNTAEIPTIVGDNQVFADTGDVDVKYKKRRND